MGTSKTDMNKTNMNNTDTSKTATNKTVTRKSDTSKKVYRQHTMDQLQCTECFDVCSVLRETPVRETPVPRVQTLFNIHR